MFDETTKDKINEYIDALFEALITDRDLLFWEGSIVRVAPTGVPPEYITVEIEGIYDENVMWRGYPGGLSVGDEVLVWENPITHRREIGGSSGTFASSPIVHDHTTVLQGDTTIAAVLTWIGW